MENTSQIVEKSEKKKKKEKTIVPKPPTKEEIEAIEREKWL